MRRMGHTLEYVRTVTKADGNDNINIGSLEEGLYLIKTLNTRTSDSFTSAYVRLNDQDERPDYWPINFIDEGGYVISAVATLTRTSLLNKQAVLTIKFTQGSQVYWLDSTTATVIEIYKVK